MSEWNRFPEKRPEPNTPVLVYNTFSETISAATYCYEDEGWYWCEYSGYGAICDPMSYEFDDDYEFHYWKPLPEKPNH